MPPRFPFFRSLPLLACLAATPCLAQVSLHDAWVRALPPGQPVTAAYLGIRNEGAGPVVVSAVSVEGAGKVEIHQTRSEDGLARMEQLSTLTVSPGGQLELAPGGIHLMLFELSGMPAVGEQRRLCLQIEGGEEVCTLAEVRKSAAGSGHAHHH